MDKVFVLDDPRAEKTFAVKDGEVTNVYLLDLLLSDVTAKLHLKLGRGSQASVVISSFGNGASVKDYEVNLDHNESDGVSTCAFYGVATGQAKLHASMKTDIKKGTTNTKSSQTIKGIMLSNEATISGIPALIIDDNNVKAAHAIGVGQVNPEHMFYLQSRGLPKAMAYGLLVAGYFNEVISRVSDEKRRQALSARVQELLH